MSGKVICFEDLAIWRNAQELAVKIYKVIESSQIIRKDFSLTNQLRSAVLSISDNIAEGFEYNNNPDFYRFLRIAKGSCAELRSKIHFIKKMQYFEDDITWSLLKEITDLGKQIGLLMKKVKFRIRTTKSPITHNS